MEEIWKYVIDVNQALNRQTTGEFRMNQSRKSH